jgi:hypothetical protein
LLGTLVHIPAGTVHWFRFGRGGGEMLSMTSRRGASKMFTDLAREVAPANPDVEKTAEVGARHGLKVAGQPRRALETPRTRPNASPASARRRILIPGR